MGTIIRLTDTVFHNDSLPRVTPFTINGFVAHGLRAAFRPAGGPESMIDLSGRGVRAEVAGAPVFESTGVIGDTSNGFVTGLAETPSFTIALVCRRRHCLQGDLKGRYWASVLLANTYCGSTTDGSVARGASCYLGASRDSADSSRIFSAVSAGCHYIHAGTGASANGTTGENWPAQSFAPELADRELPWMFVCQTVDAALAERRAYWKTTGVQRSNNPAVNPTVLDAASYARRPLANNLTGEPSFWRLFVPPSGSAWASTGAAEIAEVLFYDRALSAEEVEAQYQLTRNWMRAHRNIDI